MYLSSISETRYRSFDIYHIWNLSEIYYNFPAELVLLFNKLSCVCNVLEFLLLLLLLLLLLVILLFYYYYYYYYYYYC